MEENAAHRAVRRLRAQQSGAPLVRRSTGGWSGQRGSNSLPGIPRMAPRHSQEPCLTSDPIAPPARGGGSEFAPLFPTQRAGGAPAPYKRFAGGKTLAEGPAVIKKYNADYGTFQVSKSRRPHPAPCFFLSQNPMPPWGMKATQFPRGPVSRPPPTPRRGIAWSGTNL